MGENRRITIHMKKITLLLLLISFSALSQNTTANNYALIDWKNLAVFSGGIKIGTLAGTTTNAVLVVNANGTIDTIPTGSLGRTDANILTLVRANVTLDNVATVNAITDKHLSVTDYTDISGANVLMTLNGDTLDNQGSPPVTTLFIKGNRASIFLDGTASDASITNLGSALALTTFSSVATIQIKPNGVTQATFNTATGLTLSDELNLASNYLNFGANQTSNSILGTTRFLNTSTTDQGGFLKIESKKDGTYRTALTLDSNRVLTLFGGLKLNGNLTDGNAAALTAEQILVSDGTKTDAKNRNVPQSGTTAQRPASPVAGEIYYDTTLNGLILYNGSAWRKPDGSALD